MPARNSKTRKRNDTPLRKKKPDGDVTTIDVNDVDFLKKYVSENGKIMPIRISGLKAIHQRKVKQGIRRARTMGRMV
ncbi:MAG: 30S ribosomal protein S18 [Kiritimatiellaeota bacterium]|nr:30S ribosomal protein S18 [Kiritimatiellota bacterium]